MSPHGCERPRRSQPHRRESREGARPGQGPGRPRFPGTELHPGRQDAAAGDGGDDVRHTWMGGQGAARSDSHTPRVPGPDPAASPPGMEPARGAALTPSGPWPTVL